MSNNHFLYHFNAETSGQSQRPPGDGFVAGSSESCTSANSSAQDTSQTDPLARKLEQSETSSAPPYSNTGGIDPYLKRQETSPDGAFVDWLNFTFKCTSFNEVSDDGIVIKLSNQLCKILGFGLTSKRETGMNRYKDSYILGNDWGFVCIGGQQDTVLVTINGSGCMAAKPKWEHRLYKFLPDLHRLRITRIDLARDFFEGEYTPDHALADYQVDKFSWGARMPEVQQYGNWIKPNGKGRTLEVGNRKSGKMVRVYEKGLQLGRGFSGLFPNWVRVEGELHNQDRVIPLDALIQPGQYLAGLYPALDFINSKQTRIKTKKNTTKITYDAMVNTAKHQFGKLLCVMREMEGSDDAVLDRLVRKGIPKRLNTVAMDYRHALPKLETEKISEEKALALTFPGDIWKP